MNHSHAMIWAWIFMVYMCSSVDDSTQRQELESQDRRIDVLETAPKCRCR